MASGSPLSPEMNAWARALQIAEARGWDEKALRAAAGISGSDVWKWNKGQSPSLKSVTKLADALGRSVEELLGDRPPVQSVAGGKLNPAEKSLVDAYRALNDDRARRLIDALAQGLLRMQNDD